MERQERHDTVTVCAIAVIAMCAATVAHEAAGHGTACLVTGGRITRLTSVYFDCAPMTGITALGGPLGNLAAALLGWCALRVLPASALRWRLCALLLAALSIFWAAGYLVYAMIKKFGDYALAAHELLPVSPQIWQPAGIILGILLYAAATRMIVRKAGGMVGANAAGTFRVAWLCATMLAIAAAALYRPDPLGAVIQAGLEIGAASFPLIYVGRRITSPPQAITRSVPWIMGAAIVFGMFALSLGRGLV